MPFNSGGFNGATPAPAQAPAVDMLEAIVVRLRADPDLAALTGDSASTPKYHEGAAPSGTPLPYVVYEEPKEHPSFSTGAAYVADGRLKFKVVSAGKQAGRAIAAAIVAALSDQEPTLSFTDGRLMNLRLHNNWSIDPPEGGPNTPNEFKRDLLFDYTVQRSL